jgi:hypothetical protein
MRFCIGINRRHFCRPPIFWSEVVSVQACQGFIWLRKLFEGFYSSSSDHISSLILYNSLAKSSDTIMLYIWIKLMQISFDFQLLNNLWNQDSPSAKSVQFFFIANRRRRLLLFCSLHVSVRPLHTCSLCVQGLPVWFTDLIAPFPPEILGKQKDYVVLSKFSPVGKKMKHLGKNLFCAKVFREKYRIFLPHIAVSSSYKIAFLHLRCELVPLAHTVQPNSSSAKEWELITKVFY